VEGRQHKASDVSREGHLLHVSFSATDITATIKVREMPEWLVFELVHLAEEKDVERMTFLQVPVWMPPDDRVFRTSMGCIGTQRFTICCQALNNRTELRLLPRPADVVLMGRCHQRFGIKGARVALFGAPSERVLEVMETLELAENLPHPTLDGTWARLAPESRKSYLFIDMTERNADEIIRIAKELSLGSILIYAGTWSKTLGTYEINPQNYPHGTDGLKMVAKKADAAGLKVGIHCLTGLISKADPLATPIPDPRLAKDGKLTLAADINEKQKLIPTVESPSDFPDDLAYGVDRQGFDIQIDDEIITYQALSTEFPFGLKKCIRGAHGTSCTAHRKSANVWHLTQRFGNYLADSDTDLAYHIARRYAEVINTCGLAMIHFDGCWAGIALGRQWAWRYVSDIPLLSASLWKREVRVGGACDGPLFWHLKSFKTCNDYVEIGVKAFFDNNKVHIGTSGRTNYTPVDLGWWGLHSWAPHRRSTTPDEIEYVCQKALGFDACWSLETTLETIKACGRWDVIKDIIATYERLRLADYFPREVKEAIKEDSAEFKLIGSNAEGWRLMPARYGPSHLVLDKTSSSWTIYNDLPAQPLRFRLYSLPTLSAYDSTNSRVLVDQQDLSKYVKSRTHPECHTKLIASEDKTPTGEACVAFHGANNLGSAPGWVEHRADLGKISEGIPMAELIEGQPENMHLETYLSRSLGVWIRGDGKGEVLNIQLRAANGGYRDHYIDVDFSGWKYCELTQPESNRVFEFKPGYSTKHAVRHFQYDRIKSLFLRYNSIPAKSEVCCLIGPVKALREYWLPVKNPTFKVRGGEVVFPCTLQTEQYLEFMGEGNARLFDREGVFIREVLPQSRIAALQHGPNEITFSVEDRPELSQRVEVSLIRFGRAQSHRFGTRR